MSSGNAHELFKDTPEGKKSLTRMILIITFLILCGFWFKSLATGVTTEAPASLMQAFWTAMSFQGIKLGVKKLTPGKDKIKEKQGDSDGS